MYAKRVVHYSSVYGKTKSQYRKFLQQSPRDLTNIRLNFFLIKNNKFNIKLHQILFYFRFFRV